MSRVSVLRLVDASANRALEGVRVCEEIVRFHLEDRRLFPKCRRLRHGIAAAVRALPVTPAELAGARGSDEDIGRRAAAGSTPSLERAAVINLQRAKESLRTLEELSRVLAPRLTRRFQALRFTTYDVERDLLLALAAVRDPRSGSRRRQAARGAGRRRNPRRSRRAPAPR